jgi:DNA helicase-2/ATP-dependent DNA helicase PcrA
MARTTPVRFQAPSGRFQLAPQIAQRVRAAVAGLNPEQHQAVTATEGPVLVEAGAGTGKTKVLTTRIAHIVAEGLAAPEEVLAVTFTNKAAGEMRERLAELLGSCAEAIPIGSFHGVSLGMLRRHAQAAGMRDDAFQIFDEGDQLLVIHAAMERAGLKDLWRRPGAHGRERSERWNTWAVQLHTQVQAWKDEGRTVEEVEADIAAGRAGDGAAEIAPVYRAYQEEMAWRNAVDFADIILKMVTLFRSDAKVRDHWANRFKYVLVDEFQDTDPVQYEWLRALSSRRRNIFAVGDLDQCIYEWRNAHPEIFAGFPADWPGCRIVRLHRNYRSTQGILDVASAVVAAGRRGAPKHLQSGMAGPPVSLRSYDTHVEEADWIAGDIARRLTGGTGAGDIAILVRSRNEMPAIEQALTRASVPYAVVSGVRFHRREDVKDVVAWMRLAADPSDELALLRAAARPQRGIEEDALDRAIGVIRAGRPVSDALRETAAFGELLPQAARDGLEEFADAIDALAEAKTADPNPGAVAAAALSVTGYVAWRKKAGLAEEDIDEVMEELVEGARRWEGSLEEWLQDFALAGEADTPIAENAVRLSTIHAAKGLEFPVVYTPCLEEGVLPNDRALKNPSWMEEERRILHVAWTRAQRELIPSFVRNRRYKACRHSRFLEEAGLLTDEHREDVAVPPRHVTRYNPERRVRRIRW